MYIITADTHKKPTDARLDRRTAPRTAAMDTFRWGSGGTSLGEWKHNNKKPTDKNMSSRIVQVITFWLINLRIGTRKKVKFKYILYFRLHKLVDFIKYLNPSLLLIFAYYNIHFRIQ